MHATDWTSARNAPPAILTSVKTARVLRIPPRLLWPPAQWGKIRRTRFGRAVRYSIQEPEDFIARRRDRL